MLQGQHVESGTEPPLLALASSELCQGGFMTGLSPSYSSAGPHNHLSVVNMAKELDAVCTCWVQQQRDGGAVKR